jgi:hypothetical protein
MLCQVFMGTGTSFRGENRAAKAGQGRGRDRLNRTGAQVSFEKMTRHLFTTFRGKNLAAKASRNRRNYTTVAFLQKTQDGSNDVVHCFRPRHLQVDGLNDAFQCFVKHFQVVCLIDLFHCFLKHFQVVGSIDVFHFQVVGLKIKRRQLSIYTQTLNKFEL